MSTKTPSLCVYLAEKSKAVPRWVLYHQVTGPTTYWGGVSFPDDSDFLTLPYLVDNFLFDKPVPVKIDQTGTKTAIFKQPQWELFPEKNQYVFQGIVTFDGVQSKYMYWME